MANLITDRQRINIPADPQESNDFEIALYTVTFKYRAHIPLTRGDLLKLSQACLRLIGREVAR